MTLEQFVDLAGRRPVLVIDQFEQLIHEGAAAHASEFCNALLAAMDAKRLGALVVVLRDDFYAQLAGLEPAFVNRWISHQVAAGLDRHALEDIVIGPAASVGLRFEPGLAETGVAGPSDR